MNIIKSLRTAVLYGTLAFGMLSPSSAFADEREPDAGKKEGEMMKEESKEQEQEKGEPAFGSYHLKVEIVDENPQNPQAASTAPPLSAAVPAAENTGSNDSNKDTSALEKTVSKLQGQIGALQKKIKDYLSSRQASFGITEGVEQIDGNYGLFTGVDFTLKIEDWIAARAGMQFSYATTPFTQMKSSSDSGVTTLAENLQDCWSYSRTERQSFDHVLSWALQVVLGSLDRETLGVKDLDAYLALGGKLRLVQNSNVVQEQRTSQLLYRGNPRRDPLHHQSTTPESVLTPHFVPTAGVGVCYDVAEGINGCAEFGAGLRGTRLETEGNVGLKFYF